MRLRALLTMLAVLALGITAPIVHAQEEPTGASYITPFPENDTYKMQVIGDGFADGLVGGLLEAFADDQRMQIQRKVRPLAAVTRAEYDDEATAAADALQREPAHIVVVMIGLNDRGAIRQAGGKRVNFVLDPERSEHMAWRSEFGRRVDVLMKALRRRNAAVYWVGLPMLRREDWSDQQQLLNDVIRERAAINGVKFVDIWSGFVDESGGYMDRGPDVTGKVARLREGDGISLTGAGYRKVAHFIEREIKRDLTLAVGERSIPLAGAEGEQQRVAAKRAPAPAAPDPKGPPAKDAARPTAATAPAARAPSTAPQTAPADPQQGEQRADNGKVTFRVAGAAGREETVTVEILRPAIPAAVVAHVTSREAGDRATQVGDTVPRDIGGGLTTLSSVATTAETKSGQRRIPSTQSLYYRVTVKGEPLPVRPGRADDHAWPAGDPPLPAVARPPPAAEPTKAKGPPRS